MSKNRNKKGKNSPQINSKISLFLRIVGYSQLEIPRAFLEDFLNICLRYGFDYYCVSVDEEKRKVTLFVPLFQTKNIDTNVLVEDQTIGGYIDTIRIVARNEVWEKLICQ